MKRSLSLLLEIGEIADRHLEDVEVPPTIVPHAHTTKKYIAFAACFSVMALGAVILLFFAYAPTPVTPQNDSTDYISTQMPAPMTLSLEELIERADIIITATVVREPRRLLEQKDQLYITDSPLNNHDTDGVAASYYLMADVKITEVLKGDVTVGEVLCLSNSALEDVDADGNHIGFFCWSDIALMKQGDRVLLFLNKPFEGHEEYRLVGEAGKWFYESDGTYLCGLLHDERFPDNYTPRIGLNDYTPRSLTEWKRLVQ